MYQYSDLAFVNMAANRVISDINAQIVKFTQRYSDDIELMKKLAIVDNLETSWQTGRFVSFIRTLRKLNEILWDSGYVSTVSGSELEHHISCGIIDVLKYDSVLYEYLSCRSDGSFNEATRLGRLARLKKDLEARTFLIDAPAEFKQLVYNHLSDCKKFTAEYPNLQPCLLVEMADALEFGDKILEYEKKDYCPEMVEIKNILTKIGVFDRWQKL